MHKIFNGRAASTIALTGVTALVLSSCCFGGQAADDGGDGDSDGERISVAMMQPPSAAYHPFSDDVAKLSRFSTGETLVELNEDLEIEPHLATEWDMVDDLTWVFK